MNYAAASVSLSCNYTIPKSNDVIPLAPLACCATVIGSIRPYPPDAGFADDLSAYDQTVGLASKLLVRCP
jgi:hypothetical protein